jgi:hypothetical protein
LRIVDLDEMDRNLSNDTPEQIYRSSQQNTGLSVVGGKIVTSRSAGGVAQSRESELSKDRSHSNHIASSGCARRARRIAGRGCRSWSW